MAKLIMKKNVLFAAVTAASFMSFNSHALDQADMDLINKINQKYAGEYMQVEPPKPDGESSDKKEENKTLSKSKDTNKSYLPYNSDELIDVELTSLEDTRVKLTEDELKIINNKRRALIKYLYEQENLNDLRVQMEKDKKSSDYQSALFDKFPLSPEEIKENRLRINEINAATNSPIYDEVVSKIRTITVDLESSEPIVLDVSSGYASSMVFYDDSGKPWPIVGDIIGNGSAFKSSITGEDSHIAVFEIMREFTESNALINLKGLPIPLVIKLSGTENTVDSRLSLRIPRFGPNTEMSSSMAFAPEGVENAPNEMLEMLNGGVLKSGKKYNLEGVEGTVYLKSGSLYLRTKSKLLSPPINAPISMEMLSPGGYNVYKIPPVTHLLFAENGEVVDAKVVESLEIKKTRNKNIFKVRGN